ncbi:MAG: hypothetical protein E7478_10370, partial [Ruminococcaceae bacterium]|nr:hypothetical protein [Oscillospiraceae bacterium]
FKVIHLLAAAATVMVLSVAAHAADTHSYSVKSGTYSGAQMVWITPDEGVDLYYTTDGSAPTEDDAPVEGCPVVVAKNTKLRCAAYSDGELVERSSVTIKVRAAAPRASVKSGSYATPFGVKLTCADEDADIYYTTDGSIPDKTAQRYNGTIPIKEDTTLKFVTYKKGFAYSKCVTAEYTIGAQADPECQKLFELVNDYRAQYGLSELREHAALTEAAEIRAEELATSFSHYRPDGTKWDVLLAEYGIRKNVRAENLAGFATPEEAFWFWQNSYYHDVNMLNAQAVYLGVGHYSCGGANYWILLLIGEE